MDDAKSGKKPAFGGLKQKLFSGLAFYLSDDFVDIAKGDLSISGLKLTYLERMPIMKNIKRSTYAEARDELDRILNRAVDMETAKPFRAAVNLKNDHFVLRRFSMPDIPDNDLKKALVFEAQKYLPYALDDLTFDYVKCDKKSGTCEILFAASEKKNVNDVTAYFTDKGISPTVIEDTTTLIQKGLLSGGNLESEKAYVSLHYEPNNKVIITGILNKRPYFFRELNVMPVEEEFRTSVMTYSTLGEAWSMLQSDILTAIEYMKKEGNRPVDKILVSGFKNAEDEDKLSSEFGIPVKRVKLRKTAGLTAEHGDRHLPVLTLLSDMFTTPAMNLAPRAEKDKDLWLFKPVVLTAAALIALFIGLHTMFVFMNAKEKAAGDKIRRNFDMQKIISAEATKDEVELRKKDMEDRINFIHKIISENVPLADKLSEIGKDIPQSSWIDSIKYVNPVAGKEPSTLSIQGQIYYKGEKGMAEVNEIADTLGKDEKVMRGFNKIDLVSVTKKKLLDKEVMEFDLLLQ